MFALYHQHVLPFEITIRLLIEEEEEKKMRTSLPIQIDHHVD